MPPTTMRAVVLCGLFLGSLLPGPATAALAEPTGRVILSITGNITETNAEGRADFDRAMLERLGMVELYTSTPWTEGEVAFEGVPAAAVLDAVGAQGSVVVARAHNDYAAEIPLEALREFDAVLAMSQDGKRLRLRDKGPLWIVFPWSERPELGGLDGRYWAVWQLREIDVR